MFRHCFPPFHLPLNLYFQPSLPVSVGLRGAFGGRPAPMEAALVRGSGAAVCGGHRATTLPRRRVQPGRPIVTPAAAVRIPALALRSRAARSCARLPIALASSGGGGAAPPAAAKVGDMVTFRYTAFAPDGTVRVRRKASRHTTGVLAPAPASTGICLSSCQGSRFHPLESTGSNDPPPSPYPGSVVCPPRPPDYIAGGRAPQVRAGGQRRNHQPPLPGACPTGSNAAPPWRMLYTVVPRPSYTGTQKKN